jgi:hypothetical protein
VGANTFIIVRIMEPFWFMTGIMAALPAVVAADRKRAPAMVVSSAAVAPRPSRS